MVKSHVYDRFRHLGFCPKGSDDVKALLPRPLMTD